MFKVLPRCRAVFFALGRAAAALAAIFTDRIFFIIVSGFGIWFQLYLKGLEIYTEGNFLIKRTGNIFRRKTILTVKNISWLQILIVHPLLPGVMKISYPGETVYIIGLSAGQLSLLENRITDSENT